MLLCPRLPFLLFLATYRGQLIEISVGGIFKINSPGENAFSHAIHFHNSKKDPKFKLVSSMAMLPVFESHSVINKICQKVSESKMLAIFGGNFTFVSQDVSDLAKTLNLPVFIADDHNYDFISVQKGNVSKVFNYVLQLHPPINEPLVEYLIRQKWRTFSYICNSGQCLYRLQKMIEQIHSKEDYVELNVDVRYISDVRLASKDLRNLNTYLDSVTYRKRILIDMDNRENLQLLLHRIVLMGMNRPEYDYVITNLEVEDLDLSDFIFSGVNITGFRSINRETVRFKNFNKSWAEWKGSARKGSVTQAALMYDAVELFVGTVERLLQNSTLRPLLLNPSPLDCYTVRMPHRRKIFGYQSRTYEVKKSSIGRYILESIIMENNTPGLTGNMAFDRYGVRDGFMLVFMSMEIDKGLIPIGTWNKVSGLNITHVDGDKVTSEMIRNQTVRVVGIIVPPFMQYRDMKNGEVLHGNDRFEGFCVDILNATAEMLNFKYSIHAVSDNKYGAKIGTYPNGTEVWNGLIGELLNGTADMVFAPLTISHARAKVVDFSEPFLTFGISVMIKKPGRKNPGIFSFMMPLANPVWGSYFAACIIVSCGLYIITRLSPYEWIILENNGEFIKLKRNFTFYNSVWFAFAALVQQGVDLAPKSPGARILSSVWWFFTLIMTAYYTANLVAFLTISLMITPINDFADLLKPGIGIEYGSTNSGSTKEFFLTTRLSPFYDMGNVMKGQPHVFADTVENGVKRVRESKGKYAFLLESRMNEYFNNRDPCETMMVGRPFGDKGYGIATPINYPMKEEINDAVLKLRESQALDRLYKTWFIQKGGCIEDSSQTKRRPLTLINVAGVFYILTAGLTFALVTSLLEFYYNARKNFRKQTLSFSEFMHERARMSIHGPDVGQRFPPRRLRLAEN